MKELIDQYTWLAIEQHDDGVVVEFYLRLREDKKLMTTRCGVCGKPSFPPRPFCPGCFSRNVEWVEIGQTGTLYAFTTQLRGLRFVAPDVIGVVELPDVGRVLSKINAPYEALTIGEPLRFEPLEVSAELVVPSFSPIRVAG